MGMDSSNSAATKITSRISRVHYGISTLAAFDKSVDPEYRAMIDPTTGRMVCQKMKWFLSRVISSLSFLPYCRHEADCKIVNQGDVIEHRNIFKLQIARALTRDTEPTTRIQIFCCNSEIAPPYKDSPNVSLIATLKCDIRDRLASHHVAGVGDQPSVSEYTLKIKMKGDEDPVQFSAVVFRDGR